MDEVEELGDTSQDDEHDVNAVLQYMEEQFSKQLEQKCDISVQKEKIAELNYSPVLIRYDTLPNNMLLKELESLLTSRLHVLKCVDHINCIKFSTEEKRQMLLEIVQYHRIDLYCCLLDRFDHRDHNEKLSFRDQENLAHLILTSLFAPGSPESEWIRDQELTLFEWQVFAYETPQVIEFLASNGINFSKATNAVKEKYRKELDAFRSDVDSGRLEEVEIFTVPWELAGKVFQNREVYCHHGICYISEDKLKSTLVPLYESHLENEALHNIPHTVAMQALGAECFARLKEILSTIFHYRSRNAYKEDFTIEDLPKLCEESFPPCVKIMFEDLMKKKYLKFAARRELILFLKAIGMPAEAVIEYLRNIFLQSEHCDEQKFETEFIYYVYHLYGRRGSCKNYKPLSCRTLINSKKQIGVAHGCPFGNPGVNDIEDLGKILTAWKVSPRGVKEIFDYKSAGLCGKACATVYKAFHKAPPKSEIFRPLGYFIQSRSLINCRKSGYKGHNCGKLPAEAKLENLKLPFPQFSNRYLRMPVEAEEEQEVTPAVQRDEEEKIPSESLRWDSQVMRKKCRDAVNLMRRCMLQESSPTKTVDITKNGDKNGQAPSSLTYLRCHWDNNQPGFAELPCHHIDKGASPCQWENSPPNVRRYERLTSVRGENPYAKGKKKRRRRVRKKRNLSQQSFSTNSSAAGGKTRTEETSELPFKQFTMLPSQDVNKRQPSTATSHCATSNAIPIQIIDEAETIKSPQVSVKSHVTVNSRFLARGIAEAINEPSSKRMKISLPRNKCQQQSSIINPVTISNALFERGEMLLTPISPQKPDVNSNLQSKIGALYGLPQNLVEKGIIPPEEQSESQLDNVRLKHVVKLNTPTNLPGAKTKSSSQVHHKAIISTTVNRPRSPQEIHAKAKQGDDLSRVMEKCALVVDLTCDDDEF